MPREVEFAIKRYEVFLRDVIAPAVYSSPQQIQVLAWQWQDVRATPPTVESASQQSFTPVKLGWHWGPKWSTCWFRVRGVAAESCKPLHLRFSTATEGLVYERKSDGAFSILQGLDVNRDALLNRPLRSGEQFEFLIEAACNHPFGVTGFEWDDPEVHARWRSESPGRLDRCEIAAWDAQCEELVTAYRFALGLLKELPHDAPLALSLCAALRDATNAVDDRAVSESAAAAIKFLKRALEAGADQAASMCWAVGHAHIDTAWLWPLRETRRKCLRTFSNVLGLMERNPQFHFICSQAQQYEFVRQDNPGLFSRIGQAVQQGKWEPVGGMWVEPDANCPSGESLIRQCLHGSRYWKTHFGEGVTQRVLFLPDTFGFPASIPGIMKHCGLDTFVTNKLHWNSSNTFPYSTFDWQGIDGSVVLGHNTPGKDYNATMSPRELRRGLDIFERCHPHATRASTSYFPDFWLQPFGFGDGGGGPTQNMISSASLAANAPGLPRTSLGSMDGFVERLHTERAAMVSRGNQLPRVEGELYLELHRGTLTTQAWIKRANRLAENALGAAEFLSFYAPHRLSSELSAAIMADLDRAWKLLLLNQFHDILPGSSIGWVYEDARKQFDEIQDICESITARVLPVWQSSFEANGSKIVVNPSDTSRCEVASDGSGTIMVGPHSVTVVGAPQVPLRQPCSVDVNVIRNGLVEIEFDAGGRIIRLTRPDAFFSDASSAAVLLNQLVMYEDRPHMWDAWDIDATYLDKPEFVNITPCEREVVECSAQRVAVRFTRRFGANSQIVQVISLQSGSPRIEILNEIDWNEDHRLLRVLNAIDSTSTHALCGIQCGSISRPLVPATSEDAAKFEFCAHGYVGVGQAGSGLAVLCPDKYGWSASRENSRAVIGTSLLRAPKHPDPTADRGHHSISWTLLPLLSVPTPDQLVHEADVVGSQPIIIAESTVDQGAVLGDRDIAKLISLENEPWAPFTISASCGARVRVMATKRSEDDPDALILRVHEAAGIGGVLKIHWNLPVVEAHLVNGLEEVVENANVRLVWNANERSIMCRIWPFGILSFRCKLNSTAPLKSPTARQF